MKLIIVESPTKAKMIEKYLGNEYTVRASVGHVRDLPVSEFVYFDKKGKVVKGDTLKRMKKVEKLELTKKYAIDIANDFKPFYIVDEKKEKVIAELKSLVKKSNTIFLATDPDREGEAIAWHLKDELGIETAQRITYTEVTEKAVRAAIANPRDIDWNLKEAQEARRVLDRLVGYELSDIIWKKVRYGLSAGRVQSPALRILVEREKEIKDFIPEKYFEIDGDFETVGKIKESKKYKLKLSCDEVPKEDARANEIKTRGENNIWKVAEVKESDAIRNPNAPFTTSSLQQAGSNRFGFSPKRTMQIAQKLYEKGLITYMRTDSTSLGKDATAEIAKVVSKNYGESYLETREYKTKNKNAQEAHEAVRPTHPENKTGGSTEEENKLYNMIWARTVASQMKAAKMLRTKIIAQSVDAHVPLFSINGSIVVFDGWLIADPLSRGDENDLPKVMSGDDIKLEQINVEEKATTPPNRYTEAGLVKELEKRGIGRPSTFASIISTIEDRGYVDKINKSLIPTSTGIVVSDFLTLHFQKYTSDDFTKEMEDKLDNIADGSEKYAEMLRAFYTPFHSDVESKQDIDKATNMSAAPENILCPTCNKSMMEKLARNGTFYSCIDFPNCMGARKIDGTVMEPPKDLGKVCPKCNDGNLVERDGKFGKFVACANYPKCKYIEKSDEEKAKSNTGVKCNKCADGFLEERRGRFGSFFSCNNYPDCKLIVKTRPTGELCKICNELMIEGTKTIPTRCSNKVCQMHRPDKITP